MWSVKCRVWNVKPNVWSAKCRVWSVKCPKYCTCHAKWHTTHKGSAANTSPATQNDTLTMSHACYGICRLSPLDAALALRFAKNTQQHTMQLTQNECRRVFRHVRSLTGKTTSKPLLKPLRMRILQLPPHRHGDATRNLRIETRHVGASKRAFPARLPQFFTLCCFKIDVFLPVFSRERLRRVLRKKAAIILHLHTFTSADLHLHTFTPADLDLHTLTSADLDLHSFTSADLDLHNLTSADLDLHTFTPADLDLHTLTPADLDLHILTPADLDLHTLTSADLDLHTVTSADLHLHTLTSADLHLHPSRLQI